MGFWSEAWRYLKFDYLISLFLNTNIDRNVNSNRKRNPLKQERIKTGNSKCVVIPAKFTPNGVYSMICFVVSVKQIGQIRNCQYDDGPFKKE